MDNAIFTISNTKINCISRKVKMKYDRMSVKDWLRDNEQKMLQMISRRGEKEREIYIDREI